ncbi:NAD-dependent epimerase/dehydratase family protein [Niveibacterium sp. 24ML]|uniref:NAD-dependent epimerase/dehydratase family protein n=1 Tax=Niveibacterium sp. 24ML TaxID=2985512 RepID=UPI00226FA751|nr:NAD-dependent epimerase/dehydratase family protein [Niveibacterium sp. 24ML]MCX9158469.1 NAD-dependent epimerase/dehydratase family protein [Niveibacterium sp. 24ML]
MSHAQRPLALVTGATGFVARTLIPHLRAQGYRVRAAVRKSCDGPWDESVVTGDLSRPLDWRNAVAGVSHVFHLAARVHVMHETAADPIAAFRQVNVERTRELCDAAASAGVRRLVFLSSVKVIGEATQPGKPFRAKDAPAPLEPYAISKAEAEDVVRGGPVESVIVRPPLIYGPGVGANFARLIAAVEAGHWLPLGAVHNRRDLVFVGNLADALVRLATHPAAAGNTYLISDGESLSTAALIRAIATAMQRPCRLLPVPQPLLRTALRLAGKHQEAERLLESLEVDISDLQRDLGWTPPFSVQAALAASIAAR